MYVLFAFHFSHIKFCEKVNPLHKEEFTQILNEEKPS